MPLNIFSPRRLYWLKMTGVALALFLLFLKSDASYSNTLLVIALLTTGYYLGKLTCGMHVKSASLRLSITLFVVMNIIHSLTDGLSFTGQPVWYWLTAVSAHEIIRQNGFLDERIC